MHFCEATELRERGREGRFLLILNPSLILQAEERHSFVDVVTREWTTGRAGRRSLDLLINPD